MTDVRYRLSAEGVAEVVAAFRKVQSEALRSTSAAKRGFSGFGDALGGVRGLLAGVASAIGVISFTRLINEASNLGEQLQNLKLRFSSSAQDLSVLDVALKKSGSSLVELAPQLTRLMASTKEASRDLSGEVADNFRAAGVSTREIRDFAKQDLVGRLVAVANALQRIPEGPQRADAAIKLLGPRAAALIPILEQIGTQGFAKMYEEAVRLSAVMTDEMVAATGAVNDSFDDLRIQTIGLAAQFVTGLAPDLTSTMRTITDEMDGAASSARDLGNALGFVVKLTAAVVSEIGLLVAALQSFVSSGSAIFQFAETLIRTRDIDKANAVLEAQMKRSVDILEGANRRATALWKNLFTPSILRESNRPPGPTADEVGIAAQARAAAEASTKARNAAARAAAESELALAKAGFKLQENAAEAAFRDNLTTLREYYEERRRIVAEGLNAEIVALQKQRQFAAADREKGLAEVEKIDGQIARLALERRDQIEDLAAKEIAAYRQIAQEQLDLDRSVAEARGDNHAIALAHVEEQIAKLDEALAKEGGDEATNRAKLEDAREALNLAVEFDRLSAEAARSLDDFSRARAEIERQAGVGLLSQAEAEQKILEIEESRLEALRGLSAEMLDLAEKTENPETIARAQDFAVGIDEIRVAVEAQNDAMRRLASEGIDTARGALEQFLATGISQGPTLIGVLNSIGQAVQQLAAKFLALQIFSGILSLGGSKSLPKGSSFTGDAPVRAAEGGLISGPGTGTSDSILARLSAGEFVVRARAVQEPGALQFLQEINAGMNARPVSGLEHYRRYAMGGLVDTGVSGSAAAGVGSGETSLRIGLDRGLVLQALESPEGQRVLVRTIGKNRRAVSGILRR